jgi:hypothetical protein
MRPCGQCEASEFVNFVLVGLIFGELINETVASLTFVHQKNSNLVSANTRQCRRAINLTA